MPNLVDEVKVPEKSEIGVLGQAGVNKLVKEVQQLMNKDNVVQVSGAVMLAAQRLYQVALSAVVRRLEENKRNPLLARMVVESMKHSAAKPFERKQVLEALTDLGLPFLAAEISAERQREMAADKEEVKEDLAKRKKDDLLLDAIVLPRATTRLYVGHEKYVRRLLDRWVSVTCKSSKPVVVRLSGDLRQRANADRDQRYVVVGLNHWLNEASNLKRFNKAMAPWLKQTYRNRIDLLMVDQLESGCELLGGAATVTELNAAKAHQVMRAWCNEMGCGLVCGVRQTEEYGELPKTWDQLLVHTELLLVTAAGDMGMSQLFVHKPGNPSVEEGEPVPFISGA